MKKIFYLLLLITGFTNAQIVNIPDANFKTKLLSATTTNYVAYSISSGLSVKIDTNDDGEIQVSEALVIGTLDLNNSSISSLSGIEAFLNLTNLSIRNNMVTNIDFINSLINLNWFDGAQNQIQTVNFTRNNGFNYFDVSNNLITSVSSLVPIYISESLMSNNLITHLDLSKILLSGTLHSYNNNPLVSIDLKNNYIEDVNVIGGMTNPTLQFVCVDDAQETAIDQYLMISGMTNIVVNSYCTFTPGGNYNTIIGQVLFDLNSNGCDATDLQQPNIRININDGANQGATFTNNSGNYNFYTQAGNFVLTPNIENPTWFNFSPATATIPFANNNNNTSTQNFCISANGIHPDLEIVIAPITPARPGFDAVYQIVYKNKGNQTLSQLYGVNLFFNQNLMDFVSATTAPATIGSGSLSWSYANLLPFESRSIYVTLNINTPTDVNYPVNIGDVLQFTTSILPIAGDETTTDNTFLYNQTVVGSYDPNDITCIEGTSVSPSLIGEYLHYVINFENTGTAAAENVVVKATIDTTKFNLNSLQLLNTSHPSYVKITGNIVEFIFENIALDTGGHGNILLKIRSKGTLQSGDNVSNRGDIFFDYNAPIDTGIANTVFQSLNNSAFEKDDSVVIFPNPTQSIINIKSDNSIKSLQLYDVQGRLLLTKLTDETSSSIDILDKSNGIYFLKITSDKGIKVERIVKE
ncbi:T9SS type A sorting domain-containing protein [Flavobacterium sp.]|jgi:uncharacterized repeat protein (TIGR01451 family)|uniref:DUF7619 domain-containing protein n=1 Tax=Flavobacterium sp. TaxID=239 RepID=UPI0037C00FC6